MPTQQTCPIHSQASTNPDAPALTDGRRMLTYQQLDHRVSALANSLSAAGVRLGDRVAILAANCLEYAVLIHALPRIGASLVPLNLRWPADYGQDAVTRARCRLLLADDAHMEMAARFDLSVLGLARLAPTNLSAAPIDPDQMSSNLDLAAEATVVFTSGSTGRPRGVRLSYGNHYFNALGSNENIPLAPGHCWPAALPFYHVGGLGILFRCALDGACAYVTNGFEAESVLELICAGKVTHLSLVPTMLHALMDSDQDGETLVRLKAILLGGAPASGPLIERTRSLGLPVCTTYGMTEAASQVTTLSPSAPGDRLTTAGRILRHREIAILDEDGHAVDPGEVGEIAVRGNVLSSGYLDGPRPETPDGWFRTGDLGTIDDDGYLTVKGRKDDLIISGGENIHPAEIERVARGFPGVRDCAVVGVADEKWGQRPRLFVEPEETGSFSRELLESYLRGRLSKLHLPDRIAAVEHLPRTGIGKVDRRRLTELDEQGAELRPGTASAKGG